MNNNYKSRTGIYPRITLNSIRLNQSDHGKDKKKKFFLPIYFYEISYGNISISPSIVASFLWQYISIIRNLMKEAYGNSSKTNTKHPYRVMKMEIRRQETYK